MNKSRVKHFQFALNNVQFSLPTIQSYDFSAQVLDRFNHHDNFVPLTLDINLSTPCNIKCRYCYTSQGSKDRFDVPKSITCLSDSEIEEVIKQFGQIGGSTIFLCSEGEPLYNPEYFLRFAETAKSSGVSILTYTNGFNIDERLARRLRELDVNLVIKLESLKPETNKYILGADKAEYSNLCCALLPLNIETVLNEYADKSKIALSSMVTQLNIGELIQIRRKCYELGVAHFVKKLFWYACAEKNRGELKVTEDRLDEFEEELYSFDEKYGFFYPKGVPDEYSYDIRRFLNNYVNVCGFPARIFGHPRGGVYHNSEVVKTKFGFKEGHLVTMRNSSGIIDLEHYFRTIFKMISSRSC